MFNKLCVEHLTKKLTYGLLLVCLTTNLFASNENKRQFSIRFQSKPIPPIEQIYELNADKVKLGEMLFQDSRLSGQQSHACATCHHLKLGGTDQQTTFLGLNNRHGSLNTPTVFNASYNFRQFWDGRAKTLKDVIIDHVDDKHILNNQWDIITERLANVPIYQEAFNLVYTDGISGHNIQDALEAFLHSLVTPNSPFDRYIRGETDALNEEALKGYELFNAYGCVLCHQGPNMGGNLYQKMGIYKDYFKSKKVVSETDLGRYNVTNLDEDILVFKVPTLRNVALTAPYMHDGSAKNLEEAVEMMGEYQIGITIPKHEVSLIVKFLESLTGDQPTTKD